MILTDLTEKWRWRLDTLDHALQPVVNLRTGICFGYEALIRNYQEAGFETIDDVFDAAFTDHVLHRVDLALRKKAIEKLRQLPWHESVVLFYNVDSRLWDSKDFDHDNAVDLLKRLSFSAERICFEVSEKRPLVLTQQLMDIRRRLKVEGSLIAVDDCGAEFSGLRMMYHSEPDFIKVDRFFILDINKNPRKKLFVSSIVNIAHRMGSLVIAEGVETDEEAASCIDLGCDLIQGYWIDRPATQMDGFVREYQDLKAFFSRYKRRGDYDDQSFIKSQMKRIAPISLETRLIDILEQFKTDPECRLLPVVNGEGMPMGIISEDSLKPLAFSRYGSSYAQNPAAELGKYELVEKCPVADIRTGLDDLLELHLQDETARAVLLVDGMRYCGFLDDKVLVKAVNQRNLVEARDQNPLTRLPGNARITGFISNAAQDLENSYCLVYLDLNHFKAYNDYYGFRQGDRVIQLFADVLRMSGLNRGCFCGHIGGDDFFLGTRDMDSDQVGNQVLACLEKFRQDVHGFYRSEDLKQGYIMAADRKGDIRKFEMLSARAVILSLQKGRKTVYTLAEISGLIAGQKEKARNSPRQIALLEA